MQLSNIDNKNILVIGDVMLDRYILGDVKRISPEAPVPVLRFREKRYAPGGAANVATNLIGAKQKVYLMSVIGDDTYGDRFISLLSEYGINHDLILRDKQRKTTVKTRFLAQNNQQMLRVDEEDTDFINHDLVYRLVDIFKKNCSKFNIVIISDYMKGLLECNLTQNLINICNQKGIPIFIDPKDKKISKYKNATLLKPNKKELAEFTGKNINNEFQLKEAAFVLKKELNLQYLTVTLGSDGVIFLDKFDNYFKIPSEARDVYDVTGAGDTFLAYLAAGLANGLKTLDSVKLANLAAGVQVGKIGTSVVYLEELIDVMNNGKRKSLKEIKEITEKLRNKKKIIFTNGCFDILHSGHIAYLKKAKELGDILIVGLNSDNSVKKIKGEKRPIISLNNRIKILEELSVIDYIVVFDEETPYNLINEIKPDIIVKGGDYTAKEVVGRDIVEKYGGEVKILPYFSGESTTNIINKILKVYKED
ncbi:MAG: D-beta-D-heptose 7-phosphate kinase / D-beta-D-heptose 1-phosphate adenosyltransferase [Halanaerobiales bacterium]|nr:D-beta-D-heptose 7-phosphate kinase / D-beta-D-heptose 1-phosphate adenosyltransferase [Halanaerobiales bacterium]